MAKATANLAALNNEAVMPMRGSTQAKIVLGAGLTGTVTFEVARDGSSTYETLGVMATNGAMVTSTTAAGTWYAQAGPNDTIRARVSAFTSGSATGTIEER